MAVFVSTSVAPQCSHGNSVAHRPQASNYEIRVSDVMACSLDRSLVGQACVAHTQLRVDLRDSSGRQARERFLRRLPAAVLTGTRWHTGRNGHTSYCAVSLLPDIWPSRWKTSCGSSLRRPHAASALIQEVLLEKGIHRSSLTNHPCRPVLTSVRLSTAVALRCSHGNSVAHRPQQLSFLTKK